MRARSFPPLADQPLAEVGREETLHYVYFLKSQKNGKIYTGRTDKEPGERCREHNQGCNKWSKHNGPFKLIYYEKYCCSKCSFNREKFYKTGIGRKIRESIINVIDAGP